VKAAVFFLIIFFSLLFPPSRVFAQPAVTPQVQNIVLLSTKVDEAEFPQWAQDLRRGEIVAFGSFPFTMLLATMSMDTKRWIDANGMDFTDEGRRYAPWPLKSAGAINMTSREQETTLLVAAGMSVTIAVADFIIVQLKRNKARRRAESLPAGTAIIIKSPLPDALDDAEEPAPDDTESSED
jgi:hypothetical protein